jgi:hypothetical protein
MDLDWENEICLVLGMGMKEQHTLKVSIDS